LVLSVLVLTLSVFGSYPVDAAGEPIPDAYIPMEFKALSSLNSGDFKGAMKMAARSDHVASYYRNPDTRALALAFFEELTGRYEVARAILDESINHDVSPSLAFALAYEESGFDPKAFNRNAESVDRGVFQLNSRSFPSLSIEEFYEIRTNVRNGVTHLAFCLKNGGNEVAALAVYNAGLGRVSKGGTPRRTLDYIYRITGYRDRLEALFEAQVVAKHSGSSTMAAASDMAGQAD